jgi:hypothetical protein
LRAILNFAAKHGVRAKIKAYWLEGLNELAGGHIIGSRREAGRGCDEMRLEVVFCIRTVGNSSSLCNRVVPTHFFSTKSAQVEVKARCFCTSLKGKCFLQTLLKSRREKGRTETIKERCDVGEGYATDEGPS